ncbi:MAG: tRNA (adenosine(37)-N6)-threonylcarbamoyltransferase complex dimerization subunit type 1 TsaB [Desulfobacteraceae bacterium]
MKILAVNTSEALCSVAFMDEGELVCEESWLDRRTHSKRVLEMIRHLLENRAGIDAEDVDAFVAARGPGSFTGLRIGISVVKGLACAVNKPAVGISGTDGLAYRFSATDLPVAVLMDARRKEVYARFYRFYRGGLMEKSTAYALAPSELIDMIDMETLFVGSGAVAYKDFITDNLREKARFVPASQNHIKAAALAIPVFNNPGILEAREDTLVPEYVRKPDAEVNAGVKFRGHDTVKFR